MILSMHVYNVRSYFWSPTAVLHVLERERACWLVILGSKMASKRVDQKDARSEAGTIAMDLSTVDRHLHTHLTDVKRIFKLHIDHIAVEGVTSMAKK